MPTVFYPAPIISPCTYIKKEAGKYTRPPLGNLIYHVFIVADQSSRPIRYFAVTCFSIVKSEQDLMLRTSA